MHRKAGTERQAPEGRRRKTGIADMSTRCAFGVAVHDQGGHLTCIDPVSSQLGRKETLEDTARVSG